MREKAKHSLAWQWRRAATGRSGDVDPESEVQYLPIGSKVQRLAHQPAIIFDDLRPGVGNQQQLTVSPSTLTDPHTQLFRTLNSPKCIQHRIELRVC